MNTVASAVLVRHPVNIASISFPAAIATLTIHLPTLWADKVDDATSALLLTVYYPAPLHGEFERRLTIGTRYRAIEIVRRVGEKPVKANGTIVEYTGAAGPSSIAGVQVRVDCDSAEETEHLLQLLRDPELDR